MNTPTYISLFSGIGGLEHEFASPLLCCEIDRVCHRILNGRFPGIPIHDDVETLNPFDYIRSDTTVDVVTGGWPCQDLSIAGGQRGLEGNRSRLFSEIIRVAIAVDTQTIIAENVPHLLRLNDGREFASVIGYLVAAGFPYVAWRTLNARHFGLPHQRSRLFIIASKNERIAKALHRPIEQVIKPLMSPNPHTGGSAAGFYWTAGLHSICYSPGYSPTLKVGSSLSIPSPPALYFDGHVRKLTPDECLRLQGFDATELPGLDSKDAYRLAGNAVARPVGAFVMASVDATEDISDPLFGELLLMSSQPSFFPAPAQHHRLQSAGIRTPDQTVHISHPKSPLANNLSEFIDASDRSTLSPRAAAGILSRLARSGHSCPSDLDRILRRIAGKQPRLVPYLREA